MDKVKTTIVLISCEGYGIQSGGSLVRIQNSLLKVISLRPIVYLLDESGRIVCTIVLDQETYESEECLDRRYQNTQNGFQVSWNYDGSECTIVCTTKQRANNIAKIIIGAIDTCKLYAGRFCQLIIDIWKYTLSALKSINRTQNGKTTLPRFSKFSIREEASKYKQMLQSTTCSMETLRTVSSWWAQRSDKDEKSLNAFYNFGQALALYRLFFLARKQDDMRRLSLSKGIFSKRQMDVIREYGKTENRFKDWKREFGMSFTKPYEKYMS